MMDKLTISKQKVFDIKKEVYAYDLVFLHNNDELPGLVSNIKGVSQLVINSVSSVELNKFLDAKTKVFINIDADTLLKGVVDLLDNDRFILNIPQDIEMSDKIVAKIIQYKKRGFDISLEHFDSSVEMIKKFSRLFNFIDIIKIDVILSEPHNLEKIVQKFSGGRIKLLAENIETQKDFTEYAEMGFDYFEGYFLDTPTPMTVLGSKEPMQFIILQLIKIIKEDNSTEKLEAFIKQQPDLSYKLVAFFNKSEKFDVKIESLLQVITLMGRSKLLRWLLVYLYSESSASASKNVLDLAIKRAERMEADAALQNKDKAYLAGMFSMLDTIFETDIHELMNHIQMDRDITALVLERKGIFAGSLMRAEAAEKEYLKQLMLANFEKLNSADLINTLEENGISVDKNRL